MERQKIFLSGNLKHLRNRKNMSQQDLADNLKLSRSKIAHYESEKPTYPPLEDLLGISEYFKISVDALLKTDLSKMGELKLRELEAGTDVYLSGGKLRVLAITVNSKNNENAEFVPKSAKAGYRRGFNDPEFIAQLPKFNLPTLSPKKTYRMFPTEGRSMLPIPENSFIVTEYITDWKQIAAKTLCIVILKNDQEFLFKAVTNQVEENQNFLLESLNTEFEPQSVHAGDVLEFWQYHSHWTDKVPEVNTLGQLLSDVREMKFDIKAMIKH
jgi:transcriptional regulator with XRE-family HTH domain